MLVLPGFRSSRSRLRRKPIRQCFVKICGWSKPIIPPTRRLLAAWQAGKSHGKSPIFQHGHLKIVLDWESDKSFLKKECWMLHPPGLEKIDFFGRPNLQIQVINVVYLDRNSSDLALPHSLYVSYNVCVCTYIYISIYIYILCVCICQLCLYIYTHIQIHPHKYAVECTHVR